MRLRSAPYDRNTRAARTSLSVPVAGWLFLRSTTSKNAARYRVRARLEAGITHGHDSASRTKRTSDTAPYQNVGVRLQRHPLLPVLPYDSGQRPCLVSIRSFR